MMISGMVGLGPEGVGIASAVLAIAIPGGIWALSRLLISGATRTARAGRLSLWPTILASAFLGGPLVREAIGHPSRYGMGLGDAVIGIVGVTIFFAPPMFLLGLVLFRSSPRQALSADLAGQDSSLTGTQARAPQEPQAAQAPATADDVTEFFHAVYTNAVRMRAEDWEPASVCAATRRRWPDHPRLPELEKLACQALMVGWRAATPLDLALARTGRAQDLRHELQPLIAATRALLAG